MPDGPADVRVVLPERGIEQSVEALVAGETYIIVRVEDDRIVLEQLAEAPYYLERVRPVRVVPSNACCRRS